MATDCVCCEAIDIAHTDFKDQTAYNFLISRELVNDQLNFYAPIVKTLIPYINQVRAPPIV
jgi:hypothetical protein